MWCGCIPLAHRSVRHVSSTSVDSRHWKSRRLWGLKRVKLGSRRLSAVFLLWSKASAAISRGALFLLGAPLTQSGPASNVPRVCTQQKKISTTSRKQSRHVDPKLHDYADDIQPSARRFGRTNGIMNVVHVWECPVVHSQWRSCASDNYGPLSVFMLCLERMKKAWVNRMCVITV